MSAPVLDDETTVVLDKSTNEAEPCHIDTCEIESTHVGMCLLCGWHAHYCTKHAIWLAQFRAGTHSLLRCPGCKKHGTYPEYWAIDPK